MVSESSLLYQKSCEWRKPLLIAAAYLVLGLASHFYSPNEILRIASLASGVGFAALLLGGTRYIFGVFLGALMLNALATNSVLAATGLALGHVMAAQLGTFLLTRKGRPLRFMGTLTDYLRLIGFGSLASLLSASLVLLLGGNLGLESSLEAAIHWWMAEALGIVLFTPLILAWAQPRSIPLNSKQKVESLLLIGLTLLAANVVFLNAFNSYVSDTPRGYMMFLFISWVAIRLGVRGVTFVTVIIAAQAFAGALMQIGYFAHEITQGGLHNYWAYLVILSITGMAFTTHTRALRLALRELNLKDAALNATANGVVITDITGEIKWANQAVTELSGYSRQEILGHNPRELVRSDKQSAEFYKNLWDTILAKKVWHGQLVNRRKDGSLHDEELTITPLLNDQNEITHFVAVKQDISMRVRAEKRIAYSEALFRSLFENMGSGVAIYTAVEEGADFVFKDLNLAAEKMDGIKRADLIGKRLTTVFPGVKESGIFAFFQEVYRTGEPQTCPTMFYQDNRLSGWRENRVYRLASGEVIAIYDDVTERKRAEFALSNSHEKISALLNSMAEGAYGVDIKGNCTFVNNSFLQILGFDSADEVVGKDIHELIHHSHSDGSLYPASECQMYAAYQRNEKIHCVDEVFWRKDEVAVPIEYWSQPILTDGVMTGAIATFVDITERKLTEEKLRYSEQRFRDVSEAAGEYLWEINTNMEYTFVSARSLEVKGYTPEELLGHTPMEFMHEEDLAVVSEIVSHALENQPFKLQHRNITKTGEVTWEEVSGIPYFNKQGTMLGLRGVGMSITERKEREEQVHRLAFYDPLTHLPNRRLLNERLAQALVNFKRNDQYAALMFLDLDNFKPLNDEHGHVVGDLLLIEVANRIKSCVREVDTVARFGGDEFVIKLSRLNTDEVEAAALALSIAEKIRARVAEPYQLTVTNEDMSEMVVEHRCSASIGVTIFGKNALSQVEVMKQADAAMYQAKEAGRNAIRFFEEKTAS
jgi:diguanylate cyclase (GGDEF)-like protein/PAS domain S-box-containing protein